MPLQYLLLHLLSDVFFFFTIRLFYLLPLFCLTSVLWISMLAQLMGFFQPLLSPPTPNRQAGRRRERGKQGGRLNIKCDECLSMEKLYGMSLTLIKTICFWGADRLLSHVLMSTDSLTLMTPLIRPSYGGDFGNVSGLLQRWRSLRRRMSGLLEF